MIAAAVDGDQGMIAFLLSAGDDISHRDGVRQPPIRAALKGSHLSSFQQLLDGGTMFESAIPDRFSEYLADAATKSWWNILSTLLAVLVWPWPTTPVTASYYLGRLPLPLLLEAYIDYPEASRRRSRHQRRCRLVYSPHRSVRWLSIECSTPPAPSRYQLQSEFSHVHRGYRKFPK